MANNFIVSEASVNAMCDALVDLIDGGSGAGTIKIYEASQPADPDVAVGAQTLLATLTFTDPAFGASGASNPGEAIAAAITDDSSADATGTAAWFRAADSNGTAVFDGSVGTSSADLVFNTVSFTAGDAVSITSFTVTVPDGS